MFKHLVDFVLNVTTCCRFNLEVWIEISQHELLAEVSSHNIAAKTDDMTESTSYKMMDKIGKL